MVVRARSSRLVSRPSNLGSSERWLSVLAGMGLTLAAVRGGGVLRRLALSAAGLSLLSRGATGYCGVKSAIEGDSTLIDGLREQWQRVRARFGRATASIDSMHTLYTEELQELHSNEVQLHYLLRALEQAPQNQVLKERLQSYARDIHTRTRELERILSGSAADPSAHPDQAMQALINETYKMAQVCAVNVRDAALAGSLQRLMHYRIAAYGSVASFARALGRTEEAALLRTYLELDRGLDAGLSQLAESTLNARATNEPQETQADEPRPQH
jgi:ferritin-like metal-binding protein YciE